MSDSTGPKWLAEVRAQLDRAETAADVAMGWDLEDYRAVKRCLLLGRVLAAEVERLRADLESRPSRAEVLRAAADRAQADITCQTHAEAHGKNRVIDLLREIAAIGKDTRDDSQPRAGESTRPDEQGEAACAVCGCTEDAACESGCYWVPNDQMADMCSACAAQLDNLRGPLLRWAESVSLPGGGHGMALVHCKTPAGDPAVLVLSGQWQRAALARTLEIVEVRQSCPTDGCGSTEDWGPSDPALWAWSRLQVAGVDDVPRWWCSSVCVQEAMARAGAELAAQDRADELGGDL